jgi:hypothetical protein
MTPGEIARRLDPASAHQAGGKWRLRCPVHRGESVDSLAIGIGKDQAIVWHCHAGCTQDEVARKIAELIP